LAEINKGMKVIDAKKIGRREILKATGIVIVILLFVFFLVETSGDFANGILFFLDALLNVESLIAILLLFSSTFYLSGLAGTEIIIKKRNYILISLKYVSLISSAVSLYVILLVLIKRDPTYITAYRILLVYFLPMFLKTEIALLFAWIWASKKIKSLTTTIAI
jgi:hypothetical protein